LIVSKISVHRTARHLINELLEAENGHLRCLVGAAEIDAQDCSRKLQ